MEMAGSVWFGWLRSWTDTISPLSCRKRLLYQIPFKAVQIFGLDDAFQIQAVFPVFLYPVSYTHLTLPTTPYV